MTIFDVLTLIGGLCLFLFGMDIMGTALERRAGGKLQSLLSKLTSGKIAGLLTGLGVTAVIQSSSATTVMVVGFVNSGLMTLKQAINVIMGANIGTTVTAWILSLGGISSGNLFVQLLKPTAFTPILALTGIIFYMFSKNNSKKDTGAILLGFAVLMFGMDAMSGAVSGLSEVEGFKNLFLMFKNPILGVLAGAILTAIIQSSSASVGILQALTTTGLVSYGAAIPIIMGQNIGTCITAILSSFGTNRNAKRAALVHLSFNVIGTIVCLSAFAIIKTTLAPAILNEAATFSGIAISHSVFNIICTLILLPMSSLLEKIAYIIVPDTKTPDVVSELDERLLATPTIALERCHEFCYDMANCAISAFKDSLSCLSEYTPELESKIREAEEKTDHYEDIIGTYIVKLSTHQISSNDSAESSKLLKIIGDLERISDHAVNIVCSSKELKDKNLEFSNEAISELSNITKAIDEILDYTLHAFCENNIEFAKKVEPLEQVIDILKEKLRTKHISRLQQGSCSIETGFIWSDILTNLQRTSDHCSNIAACVLDASKENLNIHESLRNVKSLDPAFKEQYSQFENKYMQN